MINGHTEIIAHIGYPTHTFKSPMIYNPYFNEAGINAVVVPMGCKAEHYPVFLRSVFTLENIRGALITMPHKVSTVGLIDEVTAAVRVAGACNAVKRLADGRLVGDMFDGAGFVRGVQRKGFDLTGKRRPGEHGNYGRSRLLSHALTHLRSNHGEARPAMRHRINASAATTSNQWCARHQIAASVDYR